MIALISDPTGHGVARTSWIWPVKYAAKCKRRDAAYRRGIVAETARTALPTWVVSTVELVEHAENAERAAVETNPESDDRSRKLIVEVAEWQQKLSDWQKLEHSPRLKAELRILNATLDASMEEEANNAAGKLRLFD